MQITQLQNANNTINIKQSNKAAKPQALMNNPIDKVVLSSKESQKSTINFKGKYFASGYFNDEEIKDAKDYMNYSNWRDKVFDAKRKRVDESGAVKTALDKVDSTGRGLAFLLTGGLSKLFNDAVYEDKVTDRAKSHLSEVEKLVPDMKYDQMERQEIATSKKDELSARKVKYEKQKQTVKNKLSSLFIDAVEREQRNQPADIPNSIMLVSQSNDVSKEVIEWTAKEADCEFKQVKKRDLDSELKEVIKELISFNPQGTSPSKDLHENKRFNSLVKERSKLLKLKRKSNENLQTSLGEVLAKAEEDFHKTGKRTLIHVEDFDKLIHPEHNSFENIESLKGVMDSNAKLFHSTIIFTTKDSSELNNEAIQPHRVKDINIDFKSPEEDLKDIEVARVAKKKKLENIKVVGKNPRKVINDFIEVFAPDEIKPLESKYDSYQIKRVEALFKNTEDKLKSNLKEVIERGIKALR